VLVLTRRANQSIVIGRDVTITVLEIRGDQVRLGITAPRAVTVHREEVWLELEKASKDAGADPMEPAGDARAGGPPAAE